MSLWETNLRCLSIRPVIREKDNVVTLQNSFLQRLLLLFGDIRRITITPQARTLTYRRRVLYVRSIVRTIAFDEIAYLAYAFHSLGTDWGWTNSVFGRLDQLELFSLRLVLKDGSEHPLCSFPGEGSVQTGWAGVLLGGDSVVDFAGTQEADSRQAANALAKLLGVPLGAPHVTGKIFVWCPECNHPTARASKRCVYCGAATGPRDVTENNNEGRAF